MTKITVTALLRVRILSVSIHNTEVALRSGEGNPFASNPAQLILLTTCLERTKEFFTEWLSIPSYLYHYIPIDLFTAVAHAAVILGMLNLFEDNGWDVNYAREIAPFSLTMDRLARKCEEASHETDNGTKSGWIEFCKGGSKMQKLIDWYESRLSHATFQSQQSYWAAAIDLDLLTDWPWNDALLHV